ncbi:MAG: radical SAM protein [Spirochaetes bacterium]|nr:radical SAM protein [Spirochaetota bacterium]
MPNRRTKNVILITPPFTQLNAPYAATPFLAGTLVSKGYNVRQYDASLETALRFFSRDGLTRLFSAIDDADLKLTRPVKRMCAERDQYIGTIDTVIAFLQGKNPILAQRIITRDFLPEGPRFNRLNGHDAHDYRITETAEHYAALYIDDIHDLARATVIPGFGLGRYQEHIAGNSAPFDAVARELAAPADIITRLLHETLAAYDFSNASLVGITVPFPGCLAGALRTAKWIKRHHPELPVVLGGGYVNTELRSLTDSRIFSFADYITLDDGDLPILSLLEHITGKRSREKLLRTYLKDRGSVRFINAPAKDIHVSKLGTPCYDGLPLDRYITLAESENPMFRLWSTRGYVKLRAAHGCYWRRCAFCDTSLDYIARYEPLAGTALAEQATAIAHHHGVRAFHFADEAMPANVVRAFSRSVSGEGLSWWGNIRFDRTFTPELCREMKHAGCIAVSGGLEGAEKNLLAAMNKGTTLSEMTRTLKNFADVGIMTHAYLIYDFPGATVQQTMNALETVRGLFADGVLTSAYWHRFSLTVHSGVFREQQRYGITATAPTHGFAKNDISYTSAHESVAWMGRGLSTAVYNYMNGAGLSMDVHEWFTQHVPRPKPHGIIRKTRSRSSR